MGSDFLLSMTVYLHQISYQNIELVCTEGRMVENWLKKTAKGKNWIRKYLTEKNIN